MSEHNYESPIRSPLPSAAPTYRSNLAAKGTPPATPPYALSPDIIGSATPIQDATATLTTKASLAEMYDCEPSTSGDTYYYVRAFGTEGPAQQAKAQLFVAPAQLIPFPSLWGHALSTGSGSDTTTLESGADGYSATAEPFVGQAAALPSGSLTLVATAGTGEAAPTPAVTDFTDMAGLLSSKLQYGFHSVAYVPADAPAWTTAVALTIPKTLAGGGTLTIGVTSQGFDGATVGVVANGFSSSKQAIVINPITLGPSVISSVTADVEPGFTADISIQFWAGSGAVAAGSIITLSASIAVSDDQLEDAVIRGGFGPGQGGRVGVGPTQMMLLGDFIVMAASAA